MNIGILFISLVYNHTKTSNILYADPCLKLRRNHVEGGTKRNFPGGKAPPKSVRIDVSGRLILDKMFGLSSSDKEVELSNGRSNLT